MNELQEIRQILYGLERNMGEVRADVTTIKERTSKTDTRLRDLELAHSHGKGRQSVLTVVVSVIVSGVSAWAARHFA